MKEKRCGWKFLLSFFLPSLSLSLLLIFRKRKNFYIKNSTLNLKKGRKLDQKMNNSFRLILIYFFFLFWFLSFSLHFLSLPISFSSFHHSFSISWYEGDISFNFHFFISDPFQMNNLSKKMIEKGWKYERETFSRRKRGNMGKKEEKIQPTITGSFPDSFKLSPLSICSRFLPLLVSL